MYICTERTTSNKNAAKMKEKSKVEIVEIVI